MKKSKKLSIEKSNHTTGILGGAFSLTLSTIIVKVLGVIYKIPIANILGDEGMGYFNSAYTVYSFFYLLCTAGVPKAVMILVTEAKANNKEYLVNKIVKVASVAFVSLGCFITIVFLFFSRQLASLIGNDDAAFTMLGIAPSIIFVSLAGVIRGYLSAEMKLFSIAVSQIVEGTGKLVIGLIFALNAAKSGLPLPIISAMTILGVSFGALFGLIYLAIASKLQKRTQKSEAIPHGEIKSNHIIKRILSISIPITLSAAVMSITGIIDLMLIMRRLTTTGVTLNEATALYGNYTTLAVPMFNLAVSIITPISIAFLPIFTRTITLRDKNNFSAALNSSLSLSAFLTAPLMVGMMTYPKEVLSLIFGNSGIEIGARLLLFLSPGLFFMSILLIVNSALEAAGMVKVPVISMSVGSILKIFISHLLLGNPNFGIMGAPIGTVISYATALLISLIIAEKKASISIPIFKSSVIPYLNAVIAVGSSLGLHNYIKNALSDTLAIILAIIMSATIYLFLSYMTGIIKRKKLKEVSNYTNFA